MNIRKTGIVLFSVLLGAAQAMAQTTDVPVRVLQTKSRSRVPTQKLVNLVRTNFDLSHAREARVQAMTVKNRMDHVLVYVMKQGVHGFELSNVQVDSDLRVTLIEKNYHLTAADLAQLPGDTTAPQCPDKSV